MPEEVSRHSFIHLILFIVCLQCTIALCPEVNKVNVIPAFGSFRETGANRMTPHIKVQVQLP